MLERTKRFEFKCDDANGMLVGPDGCHYDTEAEAMWFNLKAACGCGNPSEVHGLLIECLRQFAGDEWPKPGVEGIKQAILKNPDAAAEFVAHYLAGEDLTEHGGSVYGSWLTDRGKQFLEIGPWKDADDD